MLFCSTEVQRYRLSRTGFHGDYGCRSFKICVSLLRCYAYPGLKLLRREYGGTETLLPHSIPIKKANWLVFAEHSIKWMGTCPSLPERFIHDSNAMSRV